MGVNLVFDNFRSLQVFSKSYGDSANDKFKLHFNFRYIFGKYIFQNLELMEVLYLFLKEISMNVFYTIFLKIY
jgi:hypothetical protein